MIDNKRMPIFIITPKVPQCRSIPFPIFRNSRTGVTSSGRTQSDTSRISLPPQNCCNSNYLANCLLWHTPLEPSGTRSCTTCSTFRLCNSGKACPPFYQSIQNCASTLISSSISCSPIKSIRFCTSSIFCWECNKRNLWFSDPVLLLRNLHSFDKTPNHTSHKNIHNRFYFAVGFIFEKQLRNVRFPPLCTANSDPTCIISCISDTTC